ncbi:rRNA pseudouridine synthase [Pseudohoeflea sp. DP4N28-3]|uniref:Pseudouridine synthase n=1 Tax=Pseudohoeflea coraliihabitans TaxID=2860393 RepID=A0ABS6WME2_9HYPH|nr:rRNA pseudouridine synthase [Pseudohoeflea sp. DP4N28-3]
MRDHDQPPKGGKKTRPKKAARADGPSSAFSAPGAAGAPGADDADGIGTGRISKFLARAGVASRRDAERMILEGRVKVNGKLLDTPAVVVSASDRIEVDGAPVQAIERTRLWIYHKPTGLVTTNRDPEGRATVFDNLPAILPRVVSIGRLDINTEGLLLLTNDGGLARALELPSTGWLRRYRVRAHGAITQERLDELKDGIAVEGVLYGAIEATLDRQQGHNVWLTMGLREGKNREIKNVLGALGLDVNRLIRVSFGPFQLGDLPEGEAVEIKSKTLRDQLGPRLIEEAGLNFDAPLIDHAKAAAQPAASDEKRPAKKEEREWISASERREKARDRLDTRPDAFAKRDGRRPGGRDDRKPGGRDDRKPGGRDDRGPNRRDDKFAGGRDDKREAAGGERKRAPVRQNRSANVWMAPGARPVGAKKAAAQEARKERDKTERGPAGEGPSRGPRGDRTKTAIKSGSRSPAKAGPPGQGKGPGKAQGQGYGKGPGKAQGQGYGKSGPAGGAKSGPKASTKAGTKAGGRPGDAARGPRSAPRGRGGPGADRRR